MVKAETKSKVKFTEEKSRGNFDVDDVPSEREDEAYASAGQEVDVLNRVCLVEDVLVDRHVALLEQWADPA